MHTNAIWMFITKTIDFIMVLAIYSRYMNPLMDNHSSKKIYRFLIIVFATSFSMIFIGFFRNELSIKVEGFDNFGLTVGPITLLLNSFNLTLLPPSGSFGVTKKAMAGRLGVGDRPFLCPNS